MDKVFSKFENMVADRFEEEVYQRNDREEISMYIWLINMNGISYESEMLAYFEAHPQATLKELCDYDSMLSKKHYPDGYNCDDYE